MNYSKWDKWANDFDESGDLKSETVQKPTCVFGKPMTEEEFLASRQADENKDIPVIQAQPQHK